MKIPHVTTQGLGLLFVHAEWCGPCQRTKPGIQAISDERDDIDVVMIDSDEDLDTPTAIGLKTYPTLVLTKDGEEVARRGSGTREEVEAWIAEALA